MRPNQLNAGQSGMSLVTVVIALGLSSLVVMGMMQAVNLSAKASSRLHTDEMIDDLASQIKSYGRFSKACTNSIVKDKFDISKDKTSEISFSMTGEVIKKNHKHKDKKYKVESLILKDVQLVSSRPGNVQVYLGDVQMKAHGENDKEYGGWARQAKALGALAVEVQNGKIVGCYGDNSAEMQCQELGGTYDATQSPPCRMGGACKPGEVMTADASGKAVCEPLRTMIGRLCAPGQFIKTMGIDIACVDMVSTATNPVVPPSSGGGGSGGRGHREGGGGDHDDDRHRRDDDDHHGEKHGGGDHGDDHHGGGDHGDDHGGGDHGGHGGGDHD